MLEQHESNWLFKVNQIICLEYQTTYLYGEVIQLIPSRGMCWFRPICMIKEDASGDRPLQKIPFVQLESVDLLWPVVLFRPAWDTEAISLLGDRHTHEQFPATNLSSRQYLHQFIREVWAANQDKFM